MVSQVTIGDIRGLLVDADKRPVLRLLPEMDEVCRGYAIAHLGDDGCSLEDITEQVWVLNVTDWIRGQKTISFNLCKTLDYSGFDRELHEFALRIAEDLFNSHEKKGGKILKGTRELLEIKRRWIEGEVSNKELREDRIAYWDAYKDTGDWEVFGAASWAAYGVAYGAASLDADWAAYRAAEAKNKLELLGDMLEDSVGIKRGFKGESLDSKCFTQEPYP